MARHIVIRYRPMSDDERRFNGRLMRGSLILLGAGAGLGLGLLSLAMNVRAVEQAVGYEMGWGLLAFFAGVAALGAVGAVWAFKKYRADWMLAKDCDLKDIHNGDVGINVLLLVPLALAALFCLGKSLSSLQRGVAAATEGPPLPRPKEQWSKEASGPVAGVWFGPKGEAVALVGGKTQAWDGEGKPLPEEARPARPVGAVLQEYSGGRRELRLEAGGVVLDVPASTPDVIQAQAGGRTRPLMGHKGKVQCLALSADGKLALSGGEDRTVRLWDLEQGKEKALLEGHAGKVKRVLFTADGKLAVSSGHYPDKQMKVWDLQKGKEKLGFEPNKHDVPGDFGLSASGKLAFVTFTSRSCVADLESGKATAEYPESVSFADHLALSDDGTRVVKGWAKRVAAYSLP